MPSFPGNFADQHVDIHLAAYSNCVAAAGGVAIMLPCLETSVDALEHADALVLTGGGDVDPAWYGEQPHDTVSGVDPHRDRVEIALALRALERGLPVLAVCRGVQVLNVALGGSLVQHLEGEHLHNHSAWDQPVHARMHSVTIEDSSIAHRVLGPSVNVNTLHHQAVGRLAASLVCSGRATDGVVESVELPGSDVWGVQWHPELLLEQPDPTFMWLIDRARERRNSATR